MHQIIDPKILYIGTPVVLISTMNETDTPNLAPMSSAWALGWNFMLGLGASGKTLENLTRTGEAVLNFPSQDQWQSVEALASLTGKNPVPDNKRAYSRYSTEKFEAAGLTPQSSRYVTPPGVAECPIRMEARLVKVLPLGDESDGLYCAEVRVLCVHAYPDLVMNGHYINPATWKPLIYNFRHYYGLGTELGRSFRSET